MDPIGGGGSNPNAPPGKVPDGDVATGELVGLRLGHFRIEAKLGAGGMGVVYRAIDEHLRREVALKVLPAEVAADAARRRRFLREAQSAAAANHPNIATIYEVGEAEGRVFIAMELIQGETLRARMMAGLGRTEALRLAREMARGLARAHERGVVHRDLKPENVMITVESEVKILDFGLAKLREPELAANATVSPDARPAHLTEEGRLLGTPSYMSPEQAQGQSAAIDARSDVFSFGVMLFEMLTGARPFTGSTSLEILYTIVHGPAPALDTGWPGAPAEVSAIVARCLAKAPADRFANASALAEALAAATSSSSGSGPHVATVARELLPSPGDDATWGSGAKQGDSQRSPSWPRRRGRRFGVALVVLGFGWVGLMLGYRRWGGDHLGQRGVAMTDHPLPTSPNPEAVSHYAMALQRLRHGDMNSGTELARALTLDPALAAAQLRRALYSPFHLLPPDTRRGHYQSALALQVALDPRDRALLPIAEAVSRDPIDYDTAIKLVRQAAERDPRDAELLFLLDVYLYRSKQLPEVATVSEQVLALDPHATQVFVLEAELAAIADHVPEAAALVDRCLRMEPDATGCLALRIEIQWHLGKCAASLTDAREFLRRQPSMGAAFAVMVDALAATGASREGIRGAIEQGKSRWVDQDELFPRETWDLAWAEWLGDFQGAEGLLNAIEHRPSGPLPASTRALLVQSRLALAEEKGEADRALQLADEFERASSGWSQDDPLGVRMKRLYLRHEAGLLTDSAFSESRNRLLDEDGERQPPSSATSRDERSREVAVRYARTATEARDALPFVGPLGLASERPTWEGPGRGRVLLLAGRLDESLAVLESTTRVCPNLMTTNFQIGDQPVIDEIQAQLLLGQVREAKGDRTGACTAYNLVRQRWRDAKPRSISVDHATARAHVLGCSDLPPG